MRRPTNEGKRREHLHAIGAASRRAALNLGGALLTLAVVSCGGGERESSSSTSTPPAIPATPSAQSTASTAPFQERAVELGVDFTHFNGMTGELYMAEVVGAGAALFDYDGDGDLDLYLMQSSLLGPGKTLDDALFPPQHPGPVTDRLYRNDLDGSPDPASLSFTDVTAQAGLAPAEYGMGLAAGDFDNDGHTDLYVTALGANRLLRNRGDGTFEDVTESAGAGDDRWSVPAAFFDYDSDGWLDLYIGNYVDFPLDDPPECRDLTGALDYCGPTGFPAQADRLLRNRGNGTFEDVTESAGLTAAAAGPALGVLAVDFDRNGHLDLYIANDQAPNHLWLNQGDGTFREEAMIAGSAVNGRGQAEASMGIDAGDYDGDGDLDLFLAHVESETNTLYRNEGGGVFSDATTVSGLGPVSRLTTAFGAGWLDYDGDTDLDLLVVNGAVQQLQALVRAADPFPLHEPNFLFENTGDGRFRPTASEPGSPIALSEVSRAAAFGDLDNDGDPDAVVTQNNGPVRILINSGSHRRWLGVLPLTGEPGRPEPGTLVTLRLEDGAQRVRRVRIEGSYCAASDPRVTFALREDERVREVIVRWPDGMLEAWSDERWNAAAPPPYTTLRRGSGRSL